MTTCPYCSNEIDLKKASELRHSISDPENNLQVDIIANTVMCDCHMDFLVSHEGVLYPLASVIDFYNQPQIIGQSIF